MLGNARFCRNSGRDRRRCRHLLTFCRARTAAKADPLRRARGRTDDDSRANRKAKKSQPRSQEKPTLKPRKAKVDASKAKMRARKKPREANQSQGKPRVREGFAVPRKRSARAAPAGPALAAECTAFARECLQKPTEADAAHPSPGDRGARSPWRARLAEDVYIRPADVDAGVYEC